MPPSPCILSHPLRVETIVTLTMHPMHIEFLMSTECTKFTKGKQQNSF